MVVPGAVATTFNVAAVPIAAERDTGCVVIVGAGQVAETVTTAVVLLLPIVLQLFETCTQYVVVTAGDTVIDVFVALRIGFAVLPEVPVYHWYEMGAVPAATTVSVVDAPGAMVAKFGFVVIDDCV